MFKKGDVVVRLKKGGDHKTYSLIGALWICTRESNHAHYDKNRSADYRCVRLATEHEIKWFEAGITNINQIPEVGGTFDFVDEEDFTQNCKETIKDISIARNNIHCFTDNYDLSDYVLWLKNNNVRNYKPPTKSTVDRELMFGKSFKPEDLKNCKIGNLTPEDHKIIQPWLFSLGYKWQSGSHLTKIDQPYLCTTGTNYIFKKFNISDYNTLQRVEIKKETILNYIKQLNTNKNYEQINKRTEIKPEPRTIRGSSIRIPVITGRIASASRLIGNKASGKCVKSQIRKFKIVANIITC